MTTPVQDKMRITAINTLAPNCKFHAESDGTIIEWLTPDISQPSESAIQTEVDRLQAEYVVQEYARERVIEYNIINQFELMSDDAINSTTTHKDAIVAIKTKWPKDNSGPV